MWTGIQWVGAGVLGVLLADAMWLGVGGGGDGGRRAEPVIGSPLQFTLLWSDPADLEIELATPEGARVSPDAPVATGCTYTRGPGERPGLVSAAIHCRAAYAGVYLATVFNNAPAGMHATLVVSSDGDPVETRAVTVPAHGIFVLPLAVTLPRAA